jgi:hypothetical protein
MDLPGDSKIRRYLIQAPVWQRYPASVILFYSSSLISAAIAHRLRHGDWKMDWAIQLEDMLYASLLMALVWTWKTRKGEQPSS